MTGFKPAIAAAVLATSIVPQNEQETPMGHLELTSPSFAQNGSIPRKYTCEGEQTSPPLKWSSAPAGTKSLALIVDDPDAPDPKAPKRTWVHWVVVDLPVTLSTLEEGAASSGLPRGAHAGKNDWGEATYGGPCPPIGRHRYFFKLYALDTTLGLSDATKAEVEKAMAGHVLGKGELVGTYEKHK